MGTQMFNAGETLKVVENPPKELGLITADKSRYDRSVWPDTRLAVGEQVTVKSVRGHSDGTCEYTYCDAIGQEKVLPVQYVNVVRVYTVGDEFEIATVTALPSTCFTADPTRYSTHDDKVHIGERLVVSDVDQYGVPYYKNGAGNRQKLPVNHVIPRRKASEVQVVKVESPVDVGGWAELVKPSPSATKVDGSGLPMQVGEKFKVEFVLGRGVRYRVGTTGKTGVAFFQHIKATPHGYYPGQWVKLLAVQKDACQSSLLYRTSMPVGEKFQIKRVEEDGKLIFNTHSGDENFIMTDFVEVTTPPEPSTSPFKRGDKFIVVKSIPPGVSAYSTLHDRYMRSSPFDRPARGEILQVIDVYKGVPRYLDYYKNAHFVPLNYVEQYTPESALKPHIMALLNPETTFGRGDWVRVTSLDFGSDTKPTNKFFRSLRMEKDRIRLGDMVKVVAYNPNEGTVQYRAGLMWGLFSPHYVNLHDADVTHVPDYIPPKRRMLKAVPTLTASSIVTGVIEMQPIINLLNDPLIHDAVVKLVQGCCLYLAGKMGLSTAENMGGKLAKVMKWRAENKAIDAERQIRLDEARLASRSKGSGSIG